MARSYKSSSGRIIQRRSNGRFRKTTLQDFGIPKSELADGNMVCANCGYGEGEEKWRPVLKSGFCPKCNSTEKKSSPPSSATGSEQKQMNLSDFIENHCTGKQYDSCVESPCMFASSAGCRHPLHPNNSVATHAQQQADLSKIEEAIAALEKAPNFDNMVLHESVWDGMKEKLQNSEKQVGIIGNVNIVASRFIQKDMVMLRQGEKIVAIIRFKN